MELRRNTLISYGGGNMSNYVLYTDGAFSFTNQQMGIGLVFINTDSGKEIVQYSNMYKGGTNNIAELAAVVVGLRMIKKPIKSLTVYTDSEYVRGCAVQGWKRKKNKAMWEEFDKQYERVKQLCPDIRFVHVKGHDGNKYNEIVDKLAVAASQRI